MINVIDCKSKDDFIHRCEPHEQKTLCGKIVKSKKVTAKDIADNFCCIQCSEKNHLLVTQGEA